MGDVDDRVRDGLRTLVDRAPVDAEVWVATERHVDRAKHHRQLMAAATVVAIVAVVGAVGAHAANSHNRVRVATTTPTPTTTATTTPPTVPTTSRALSVCPVNCVGRATADVDGDGRPDQIGLFADPPLSKDIMANRPSKLVVRVAFATGRVAEYDDTADWDASLIGAFDLNGNGRANIFYFNFSGANNRMGHILRWNGSQLVAVQGTNSAAHGVDGTPFTLFTSGYALGGDGFRCTDKGYVAMTIGHDGVSAAAPSGWSALQTTYQLRGNELVRVDERPIAITSPPAGTSDSYVPPEYDQIIGVHCPGVPPGFPYVAQAGP